MENQNQNNQTSNTVFTPTQTPTGASFPAAQPPVSSQPSPIFTPSPEPAPAPVETPIVPDENSLEAPSSTLTTGMSTGASTLTSAPTTTPEVQTSASLPVAPKHRGINKAVFAISGVAVLIVVALVGVAGYVSRKNISQLGSPSDSVNEQSLTLGEDTGGVLSVLQKGNKNKLIVNGDVVTRGSLFVGTATGDFFGQFDASGLTADQVYTLPNESGEVCLSSNNCSDDISVPIQSEVAVASQDIGDVVNSINGEVGDVSLTFGSGDEAQTINLLQGTGITLTTNQSGNSINIQISTTAFLQGGNKYGATAVLGTNDNFGLQIRTNGATAATIASGGATTFKNATNSSSGFAVQNASGSNLLVVNTSNSTVNTESLVPLTAGTITTTFYNTDLGSSRSGRYSNILMDNTGLPRMVFYKPTAANLGFVKCNDILCTSYTERTLQSSGSQGNDASAAVDSSNNIHIAYRDGTNQAFKFLRCNTDCSTMSTPVTILSNVTDLNTRATDLAVGTDGFARIFVQNGTDNSMTFIRCTNSDCSASVSTVITSGGSSVSSPGVALASDNTARLVYHLTGTGLRYVQCTNANCSTSNVNVIDSASSAGDWGAIALDSSGIGHVSYQGSGRGHLTYVNCLNAACSSKTTQTIDGSIITNSTSIILNSKGIPQIGYKDSSNNFVKHATCDDQTCATPTIVTVDGTPNVGQEVSMVMGTDGYAQLAYFDTTTDRLGYANLGSSSDSINGSNIGTASSYYASLFARSINADRFILEPTTNSSTAMQVKTASGVSVFTVNTTDKRVGIGPVATSATLTVGGAQPNDTGSAGTDADAVLSVVGAKGGNTVGTTGQLAGTGGSVTVQAGNGGDAPSGSTNGTGGSITLQAGTAGSGLGTAGTAGNIYFKISDGSSGTVTYQFATTTAGTYDICTSAGNCVAGSGAFVNGGNSFSAPAILGTNDSNSLSFETAGNTQATIAVGGATTFQNSTDSTSAFAIKNAAGTTTTFLVDTTNNFIDVGGRLEVGVINTTGTGTCASIIGNFSCNAAIDITETYTNPTAASYGIYSISLAAANSGANAFANVGSQNLFALSGTQNFTGSSAQAANTAVSGDFINIATGTVTEARGIQGSIGNAGTALTTASAVYAYSNATTGTITNSYGLQVAATATSGGGVITNNYGVRVRAQTAGGSDYGIAIGKADTYTLWVNDTSDSLDEAGGIVFGTSHDTNLYRLAANTLRTDDQFSLGTLGSADNATYLCRNSSNIIATCSSGAAGAAYVNGGNSFGGNATIGLNDAFNLTLETANTTACTISGSDQSLSCPGAGSSSERFGSGALAAGSNGVAIGNAASASNDNAVAIGQGASASGLSSIAIGRSSAAGGTESLAIGEGASAAAQASLAIGDSANTTSGHTGSIALGYGATTTAGGQFVVGGSTHSITNVYLGNGVLNAVPTSVQIIATSSSANGAAGGALNISGGAGRNSSTGSAGGAITVQGGPGGGSSANAGGLVTIQGGGASSTGAGGGVTILSGAGGLTSGNSGAVSISTGNTTSGTAGNISIDVGTSTSGNGSILIGTAARAQTITIGNITSSTSLSLNSGTGAINIGTAIDKTITIGNTTGATGIVLSSGTGDIAIQSQDDINIGTNTVAQDIVIGNSTGTTSAAVNCGTGTCSFGANAVAHTTDIGSSTGTSTTRIFSGSGGLLATSSGDTTIWAGSGSAIGIGNTVATVQNITIGNTTTTSSITLQSGTGDVTITSQDDINIGTSAVANEITIGNQTDGTTISLQTGSGSILIGANAFAHGITIGNGTGATAVSVQCGTGICGFGNNATDHSTTIGSTTSVSATTLQSGTGGLSFSTAGSTRAAVSSTLDGFTFGSGGDTNLYRSAADTLKTDDAFAVGSNYSISSAGNVTSNATGNNQLVANGGAVLLGSTNVSTAGTLRFKNNELIGWRNAANGGDLTAGFNGSDVFAVLSTVANGSTVAQFNNAGAETCTISPGAGTQFACSSDARLKNNVVTIASGLDVVKQLRGVNFNWIDDPNQKDQSGFIAQELMQILPEAVSQDGNGYYVANYTAIIPYLVGAAQQQDIQITGLQDSQTATAQSLSTSSGKIDSLEQRVTALEASQPQGNNSNFATLNVSGAATVQNLTVTGSATIAQLTVTGNATFAGSITIQGHVLGNADTRGTITIPAGQVQFKRTFDKPYTAGTEPNIILTAKNTFAPKYRVESSPTDFTVFFDIAAPGDVVLNYQVQE